MTPSRPQLTLDALLVEAELFAAQESVHPEPAMFGVTDGKAVGTYIEHKFQAHLHERYLFAFGSSAKGIDYPELDVDLKFTSVRQPQSSCPFRSARQKVYGLGYSLLVFVYDKTDDPIAKTGTLNVLHVIYVDKACTADWQTTSGILKILANQGNLDDLLAFMSERMLPLDEIQAEQLAEEIMATPPQPGYLTISNALQWRLQYRRVIEQAGAVPGITRVL
ncbi:MAG: restriction endonuclease [Pirellulales bacterium]|nr:restriction endonuclease [Pirellulales bacterium]